MKKNIAFALIGIVIITVLFLWVKNQRDAQYVVEPGCINKDNYDLIVHTVQNQPPPVIYTGWEISIDPKNRLRFSTDNYDPTIFYTTQNLEFTIAYMEQTEDSEKWAQNEFCTIIKAIKGDTSDYED